jgi:hypothetical protein
MGNLGTGESIKLKWIVKKYIACENADWIQALQDRV